MKLTARNVNMVLLDCLFNQGEDTSKHVIGRGVMKNLGFHPERLESHKIDIESMLSQLPEEFKNDTDGGASFLNACVTSSGEQWGEHNNVDELLCLGVAIEKIEFLLPKMYWSTLPGGVPYFKVK